MGIPLHLKLPAYDYWCYRGFTILRLILEAFELGGGRGHCSITSWKSRGLLEEWKFLIGLWDKELWVVICK